MLLYGVIYVVKGIKSRSMFPIGIISELVWQFCTDCYRSGALLAKLKWNIAQAITLRYSSCD